MDRLVGEKGALHLTEIVGPGKLGQGTVPLNLAREQQRQGWNSEVWCVDTPEGLNWASEASGCPRQTIRSYQSVGPAWVRFSPAMRRAVTRSDRAFRIVHQHGIWTGVSQATCEWRRVGRGPTVIAPHGALEPTALRRSPWKKALASALYEGANLRGASCLHATSQPEADGFREYGLRRPIALIPNGVSDRWLDSTGDAAAFRREFGIPDGKRIALFLSRVTPVKGLPMLLAAVNQIRGSLADWTFVIAGADEFNHLRELISICDSLQLGCLVRFVGPLTEQRKRDVFAAASLFVLPTHREAAPVVVLEALGAGVPVLTTRGAPWEELVRYGCGWWVDVNADSLAEALEIACSETEAELREMGRRGLTLVKENYTWKHASAKTIQLYAWLLDGGERPPFVWIDE